MPVSNPYQLAGVLPGQPGNSGTNAYGYIPWVPNLADTAAQAIAGGLQNLPGLADLLKGVSSFTSAAARSPYTDVNPNWFNYISQGADVAGSFMQGQMPQTYMNNLINNAVANKYAHGIGMSPNLRTSVVQQLLGGEQEMYKLGVQGMQSLAGLIPQGKQLDPASFIPSAADWQNWSYLANQLKAAPDPTLARQAEIAALMAGANRGSNYRSPYGNPYGMPSTTKSFEPSPPKPTTPTIPYAPPGGGSGVWRGHDGSTWNWDNGAQLWRNVTTGEYSTDDNLPASSEQIGQREEDWWWDYVGGNAPFEAEDYYSEGGYTYDPYGYNYDPYYDWSGYNVEAPDYEAALNYNLYGDYYGDYYGGE